jgi:hypothetical protein
MADVTINYKGTKIAELSASGTKTLKTSGTYCEGDISVNYIKPSSIPKGLKIKYIIPATLVCPDAANGFGIGAISFTFTRENVNQLFNVDWLLQEATDSATNGYWVQHYVWTMNYEGNYSSQHILRQEILCSGKAGNHIANGVQNMAKTALSASLTTKEQTGASATYTLNGRNFKGLIFIFDSSYDGLPIVDETKLSQFLNCNCITAGW